MKNKLLPACLALFILLASAASAPFSTAPDTAGLRLLRSDADGVLLELLMPQVPLETAASSGEGEVQAQTLALPGANATSDPGWPQLPQVSALVGVPPGAQVELRLLVDEPVALPGRVNLAPAPSPSTPQSEFEPGTLQHIPDPEAYASSELYPPVSARLSEIAVLRDRRLVRVELFPFQYIPAEGKLVWRRLLRVEVRFTGGEKAVETEGLEGVDDPFEGILKQELINYEAAREWHSTPALPARGIPAASGDSLARAPSNPADGPRYKIKISEDGIYRLTYKALKEAGLPVDTLDPATLKLTNQGREVAVAVTDSGEPDQFNDGEALLFFGEKFRGDVLANLYQDENENWYTFVRQYPDGSYQAWKPEFNATMLEKYTDENVYWLSYGGEDGKRMALAPATSGSPPTAGSYRALQRFEQNLVWRTIHFAGEETWFWQRVKAGETAAFTFNLSALAPGAAEAKVRGELVASTYSSATAPDHHTRFYLNQASFPAHIIDEFWDNRSRYPFEKVVSQSQLVDGENQLVFEPLLTADMGADEINFDWFAVEFERLFQASGDNLDFKTPQAGPWRYDISGYSGGSQADYAALQVSDPAAPQFAAGVQLAEGILSFTHQGQGGERFYAGKIRDLPGGALTTYTPPVLTPADYVLITPPELLDGARELAAYRESQGLSTLVVDLQAVYDEFNFGIRHPIAIKNFLRRTFDPGFWPQPPTYAVLLGDGHWNLKNYPIPNSQNSGPNLMPPYLAWVDPWQGEVDSSNLLAAVTTDPITGKTDPLPDVLIGRIPVNSAAELEAVISKIQSYESAPLAPWRGRALFVADDPDSAGNFEALSEAVIEAYFAGTHFSVDRVYLDQFSSAAEAKSALLKDLNQTGALVVNYTGHASLSAWTGEGLFTSNDIQSLTNGAQLPVVLSMTCLDGYWIHPTSSGLIEDLLRAQGRGAVAAFSPTGLGVASGHDELHRGFYDLLLLQRNSRLGAAAQSAKLRLFRAGHDFDLLHTYTVFGDPALNLRYYHQLSLPMMRK